MKFIIRIPILETKSAGVRVLIHLANMLNRAGYCAEINAPPGPHDIMVYPDLVRGNPDNASRIVRYMLYYPAFYFGGDRIPDAECVIVYNDLYFDSTAKLYDGKLTKANILAIPAIEQGLCSPGEKTVDKVLYVGKSTSAGRPKEEMPLITRDNMSRSECINLLRSARNLYCCDEHSAILVEAVLCGCQPWVVLGPEEASRITILNFDRYVQDDERDTWTARRFAAIALDFFRI